MNPRSGSATKTLSQLSAVVVSVLAIAGLQIVNGGPAAVAAPPCTINGTSGQDVLTGGPGADVICGLDGDDHLVGGTGADHLIGGAGTDTLDARDGTNNDVIDCGAGPADHALADPGDEVARNCEAVTQVSPSPRVTLSPSPTVVAENEPAGTEVGQVAVTNGKPISDYQFRLIAGPGGDDNASFTLSGRRLLTAAPFDYEADHELVIRIRATDTRGNAYDQFFTITVTDIVENLPPTNIALSNNSVPENQPSGTTVGTLTTTDPDAGDTHTYTLVTGAGDTNNASFQIDGSTLKTNAAFDYETKASYTIRIQADDGNGGTYAEQFSITITDVGEDVAPVAANDTATVVEDAAATAVTVLTNDTNPDGGPMAIASATQPAHGTVVLTGGSPGAQTGLTYQPDANYCNSTGGGADTFTYTLNGGSTATASVTVTCVDDNPVAVNDTATVAEDSNATAVTVLSNDTDLDSGPKAIAAATQPADGTVVLTGGSPGAHTGLTYAPGPNYCNTHPGGTPDTFTYTLNGGGSTATVSITVTCVDDNPAAVDDTATVAQDAAATAISVLTNDTDPDAGTKAIASATQPTNGTVVLTGGSPGAHTGLTYAPDAGYCNSTGGGADTFTYTLNGGDSATVSVTVTCKVDVPPVAVSDTATLAEDAAATVVTVLTNDTNADGGPMAIASATQPTNGTVVLTGGSPGAHTGLSYEPDSNYCNSPPGTTPDTFTYTLNGGSTANVSITVTCADDNPVAVDDTATVAQDANATAINVLTNDTDLDAGTKAIASATQPTNGTVVLTGGSPGAHTGLTYQPGAGYCNSTGGGADTFTYTLNGGDSATVSITVTCASVNAPPVIADIETTDVSYTEGDPATLLTATATVTDADSPNFDTGRLVAEVFSASDDGDRLEIRHQGAGSGQIGVSGSSISFSGVTIGFSTGGSGSTPLTIMLNAGATPAATQALLRAITYRSVSTEPTEVFANRPIRFTLDDGDGGPLVSASRVVAITGTSANPVLANMETSAINYQRGNPAVLITGTMTVSDTDSANFNGGRLTVSTTVNPDNSETYVVRNQGTGAGQFAVTGTDITYEGATIGWFTGGTGGTTLTIRFDSNAATPAVVQALVRNITYSTPANAQPIQKRLTVVVTDGDGGTSTAATRLINVTS